jgi:hypothetical protein
LTLLHRKPPDVTSLLPLLTDSPRPPATEALAGGPAAAPLPGAGANDFAGLVEAFAAPPSLAPTAAAARAGSAPLLEGTEAEGPRAADPDPALPPPATALSGWPTGKNLPEPGALLPPAPPPAPLAEVAPAPDPTVPPVAAALPPLTHVAEDAAQLPAVPARAELSDIADGDEMTVQHGADQVAGRAKSALRHPAQDDPAHALPDEAAPARHPAQPEEIAPGQTSEPALTAVLSDIGVPPPDPALLPQPVALALPPVRAPALEGPAVTATRHTAAAAPAAAQAAAQTEAAPNAPRRAAPAPVVAPLLAPGALAAAGDAVPTAALAAEPTLASASGALPQSEPAAAPTPAPGPAASNLAAALPPSERPGDPRGGAPATPAAAQLESAVAQVSDIREALRSARPAMTLQHAEFGAVSIRLEPAAPDQWRAVLASRDPGFVPAIQAALAERAVAATSDTSSNFSGQSGAHHNGTSDQRYGSTPNGGQGSPQPYLGQSGSRDGEAAPDHRRPSTAAALAARGDGTAEDSAAPPSASGGLFA